jgi:tetratricopeptide (TPR) repeat protein
MSSAKNSDKQPDPIWQQYTKEGNSKMKVGSIEEAKASYDRAIAIAENLWQQACEQKCNPETIHLYVITCHNLADCYEAMKLSQRAESYLIEAYRQTLTTMNDINLPLNFRMEAYQGLQMVLRQLIDFYHRTENPEAIASITLESQQQAQKLLKEPLQEFPM